MTDPKPDPDDIGYADAVAELDAILAELDDDGIDIDVLSERVGRLILSTRDLAISLGDPSVVQRLVSVIVLAVSVTWFAVGLGLIIRNSPATVTILLLWPLLIEGLIGLVLSLVGWENASKWMPYQAAIDAAASDDNPFSATLGRPLGLVYFAAVAAVLIAIGAVLDHRRDA